MGQRDRFLLGDKWIDLERGLIFDGDQPGDSATKLHFRAAKALTVLVEAKGAIVTRETLTAELWGEQKVDESSLNQCILQLRKALGNKDLIETIPRIGYRLPILPTPTLLEEVPSSPPLSPSTEPQPPVVANPVQAPNRRGMLVWGTGAVASVAASWYGFARYRRIAEGEELAVEAVRLGRKNLPTYLAQGLDMIQRALRQAPDSALVNAHMAELLCRSHNALDKRVRDRAQRAVALDPNCAEAHATLGWILFAREWRWADAKRSLDRALQLNPDEPYALMWMAQWLLAQLQFPQALSHIDRALLRRDSPLFAQTTLKGAILYCTRQFDAAIIDLQHAKALEPNYFGTDQWMAHCYLTAGKEADAVRAFPLEWGVEIVGTEAMREKERIVAEYDKHGLRHFVQWFLQHSVSPGASTSRSTSRAAWLLAIQDLEGAMRELEGTFEIQPLNMIYIAADPVFTPLRRDPRYQAVLRKVGLPEPKH